MGANISFDNEKYVISFNGRDSRLRVAHRVARMTLCRPKVVGLRFSYAPRVFWISILSTSFLTRILRSLINSMHVKTVNI